MRPLCGQLTYALFYQKINTIFMIPLYDADMLCHCIINYELGISLLSPMVMRQVHADNKDWLADALLKRRSLYIMR